MGKLLKKVMMSAEALPRDLWRKILETGAQNLSLGYRDLCCLSVASKWLNKISGEDSLWCYLLSSDFPKQINSSDASSSASPSSIKSIYKIRFEKERERKMIAHKRMVYRKESLVFENTMKVRELERKLIIENKRLRRTTAELSNLQRARQASVALNVWQPAVVRGRHRQIVEQCFVPAESRLHALEMELNLNKQQIDGFEKAYRLQKERLDKAKEELNSMKYHPLRENRLTSSRQ